MAELTRIEYEHCSARKIIGLERRVTFHEAGKLWREYFETGIPERMGKVDSYFVNDIDDYIGMGHMSRFNESSTEFNYIIGKYVSPDAPVPVGLSSCMIPEGIVAKAWIKGEFNDILNHSYFLITEAIEKNGYVVDYNNFYWCDVYTYERYCNPSDRGDKILTLDYFMPCVKKSK